MGWFALLHEFEKACGVNMNYKSLVKEKGQMGMVLDTSFLPDYMRSVILARLQAQDTAWDLMPGEIVRLRISDKKSLPRGQNQVLENPISARFLSRVRVKSPPPESKKEQEHNPLAGEGSLAKSVPIGILLDLLDVRSQGPSTSQEKRNQESMIKFSLCTQSVGRILKLALMHRSSVIYPKIRDSINLLCRSIRRAAELISGELIDLHLPIGDYLSRSVWCQSRQIRAEVVGMEVLGQIAGTLPVYDNSNHNRCTKTHCIFSARSASIIEPNHVDGCGIVNCRTACVSEQELINVLDDGGNPCLLLEEDGEKLVVSDIRKEKHVAISHVWRHGLGNPIQNSIPWYQVTRLFQLVSDYKIDAKALWLDTLTVPISPDYKFEAIKQLRTVYREAEAVLVLDSVLQQVGSDRLEQCLQFLGCEWLTRLWTLQEGRLVSKLLFQFREDVFSTDDLINIDLFPNDRAVFADLAHFRDFMGSRLDHSKDLAERFGDLLQDLAFRKITEPNDEPICVATMVGLSLENLGDKSNKQISLSDIIRALPNQLLQDLIFVPSPRLQEDLSSAGSSLSSKKRNSEFLSGEYLPSLQNRQSSEHPS